MGMDEMVVNTMTTRAGVARGAAGSAVPRPDGRVPDFFIVGHPKCGTTALYEMLRRHPQIHMPAKEPRFFAMREIDMGTGYMGRAESTGSGAQSPARAPSARVPPARVSSHAHASGKRPRTLDGYLALFAGAQPGQLVGEASPEYLRSTFAAERIAATRPDARIIAVLREPASFLRSVHLQAVRGYNETQRDFRKALELEAQRRAGRHIPRLARTGAELVYSDLVRYVEQLRRYHAVFPPGQVLVLIYEEFQRDNEATVRRVLKFLEVNDTAPIEQVRTRPSRDLRFRHLHRLVNLRRIVLRNVAAASALSQTVNTFTPRRLRGTVRSSWRRVAYNDPTPPDEELIRELRHRFKGEVQALSEYLDRDLVSLWGYDDVSVGSDDVSVGSDDVG